MESESCTLTAAPPPQQPVTLNMGMRMTSWYDIKSLQDIDQQEDEAGLFESKRLVWGSCWAAVAGCVVAVAPKAMCVCCSSGLT
eukprot:360539-Chlamydomonas_euryale.AAC.5